jgi:DNA-binding NtrC family response regulator
MSRLFVSTRETFFCSPNISSKAMPPKEARGFGRVEKRTAELLEIFCDSDTFFVEEAWLQVEAKPWMDLQPSLVSQERELIEEGLAETRGRISGPDGAARRLGVPKTTLESKIKSLRIDKHRFQINLPGL